MKNESIINIINALEQKYNSSFIPISDITSSPTEIEYILSNKKIFFSASKSRIILTHWLCEKIREIYQKVQYSPLDMSNEVYEELRKSFNTKAFNKIEYLKLFGCEKKHILEYENFEKIETDLITEYNNIVPNDMKLSTINHVFVINKEKEINLKNELKEFLKKDKQEKVLYWRASGMTLDAIGEKLQITRERARQIEIKPKALIERWMDNRGNEIINQLNGNILVDPKEAEKFFGNTYWQILKYTASNHKNKFSNWYYIKELDTICYSSNLYDDIQECLKTAAKNKNTLSQTVELIQEKGYDFMSTAILEKFCSNSEFYIYNNIVYNRKLNIGKSILIAAETDYKNGINIGNKEELKQFAEYLNKNFGLHVKPNRALTARIQDVLVMSDSTLYKSNKYITNNNELDESIKKYMSSISDDRTTYQQLFDNMPKDLMKKAGITNYSGLHGYVKKHEEMLDIISLRYYVCKKDTEELLSKGFFFKLSTWLKEQNKPVETKEILKEFDGWTTMYPKYAMLYYPEIVQWSKDTFINLDIIKFSEKDIKTTDSILTDCLNNSLKYTNIYIVYKKMKNVIPKFFESNKIKDESQLYHILKYYFRNDNKYVFTKPHILSSELGLTEFTTEDLLNLIIGTGDSVTKSEITDGINKYYGGKNSSLALALQKVIKDFIRIEPNKYYRKSKIKLSKKDIAKIELFVEQNLIDNKYLVPEKITDFSSLPKTSFKWNSWALCEIINMYSNKYKVLIKRNNIMQNTMVIVTIDSGFNTKEQLLDYILHNKYTGNHSEEEVSKFVKDLGIYSSNFNINTIKEEINFEFC